MATALTHLTDIENRGLDDFKKAILDLLKNSLVMLRLFGSKARGDFGNGSDLDVAIVIRGDIDRKLKERIYEIAFEITFSVDYAFNISPVVFTEEEFNHLCEEEWRIALDIINEGIEI
jgi:predicted nucleotidyltransferase